MAKPGPRPMPTAILALHGSKVAKYDRGDEIQHAPGTPECPEWETDEVKAEWARIIANAAEGLIQMPHRAILAMYCHYWAEWQLLARRISFETVESVVFDCGKNGAKQLEPLIAQRDKAADMAFKFAKEFGLTPSSMVGLKATKSAAKSNLEEFLKNA